ncbi:hypothetical protein GCM10028822_16520 [Hymenobacter terrigena]
MMDLTTQLSEQKMKVDFDSYDITVKELINMVKDGYIDIAPDYQRQFRWDEERQSTLVESIFLGIPVPSLFTAANKDGTWELVDGVQRLSTMIHFAGDAEVRAKIGLKAATPLQLKELLKLTAFNGKSFTDIPRAVQMGFELKPIKVVTLSDKSVAKVRFDLFERLNSGGIKLTDQEIRSCILQGKFNEFLKERGKSLEFQRTVKLPKSGESDGTREEWVLRFFSYLNSYKTFDHSVKEFLTDYMTEATKQFSYKAGEEIFDKTFHKLATALPNGITRSTNRNNTPANLYEAVAVGAALALLQKDDINLAGIANWMQSNEMKDLTTGATNSRTRVKARIEFCRDQFLS